jgi:hypothetical protein
MSGSYREVKNKLLMELENLYKMPVVAEAWNLCIKEEKNEINEYFYFDNSEVNHDDSDYDQLLSSLFPSHLADTIQKLTNNGKQKNDIEEIKDSYLDFEQWKLSVFSSNLDNTIQKMTTNWNNSFISINKDKQEKDHEAIEKTVFDFEQSKLSFFASNFDDSIQKMTNNANNSFISINNNIQQKFREESDFEFEQWKFDL